MGSRVRNPAPPDTPIMRSTESAIHQAIEFGDVALLSALAANKQTAGLLAVTVVRSCSSYEMRNSCASIPIKVFCDTSVLLTLMQRIREPDEENEFGDVWDGEQADTDVRPMNPNLRKDLLTLFKAATSSFDDTSSFAQFMQKRIELFDFEIVGSKRESIRSLRHAARMQLTDSKELTKQQLSRIYSLACLYPADTMYSLIHHCLADEKEMPAVVRLVTNELKSCATAWTAKWDQNLLTSVITQCLFFSLIPDIPEKLVKLISMIQKAAKDEPILPAQVVLCDWIGPYGYVDDMARQIRATVLLMESRDTDAANNDMWTHIDLVSLLKFFVDCLLDVCHNSPEKQRLLNAIDRIMRKHIQRLVTAEEIEELRNMYQFDVNRLPICYLQPYTHLDLVYTFDFQYLTSVDILLIVSMLDRDDHDCDLHTLFTQIEYPEQIFRGLLPFTTPKEFSRLYKYLTYFFDPTDVICCALRSYRYLMEKNEPLDWAPVLQAFEHVFRQHYQCGSNLERQRVVLGPDDQVTDEEEDSEDESSCSSSAQRQLRSRSYRMETFFKEVTSQKVVRKPFSLFRALHTMLRLEYLLTPDPLHLLVKGMVLDFLKVTSNRRDEWDNPLPSPVLCYQSRSGLWLSLIPEQRDYLIEVEPLLSQCNERIGRRFQQERKVTRRI